MDLITRLGFISNMQKSYGFITPLDANLIEADYFFHKSILSPKYSKNSSKLFDSILIFTATYADKVLTIDTIDEALNNPDSDLHSVCKDLLKTAIKAGNGIVYLDCYKDKKGIIHWKRTGSTHKEKRFVLDYYLHGPEYYLLSELNDINSSDEWLKYMETKDPEENIFQLFCTRFYSELAKNNFDNDLFYSLLFAHSKKWRDSDESWKLAWTLRPRSDDFSHVRKYGYLVFGQDKAGRFGIFKQADKKIFNKLIKISEGMITEKNYNILQKYPSEWFDIKKNKNIITWPSSRFPYKDSLFEVIQKYFEKFKRINSENTPQALIKSLEVKDKTVDIIREYAVCLSVEFPSWEESSANNELLRTSGYDRDLT